MDHSIPKWLSGLSEEDYQFIKRFLLASGSLKDVACEYGISYPTVRARLDRLIEKIRLLDTAKEKSPFHQEVKLLVLEGELDISTAKKLIRSFEKAMAGKEKT
jgi:hypothetical protein